MFDISWPRSNKRGQAEQKCMWNLALPSIFLNEKINWTRDSLVTKDQITVGQQAHQHLFFVLSRKGNNWLSCPSQTTVQSSWYLAMVPTLSSSEWKNDTQLNKLIWSQWRLVTFDGKFCCSLTSHYKSLPSPQSKCCAHSPMPACWEISCLQCMSLLVSIQFYRQHFFVFFFS